MEFLVEILKVGAYALVLLPFVVIIVHTIMKSYFLEKSRFVGTALGVIEKIMNSYLKKD